MIIFKTSVSLIIGEIKIQVHTIFTLQIGTFKNLLIPHTGQIVSKETLFHRAGRMYIGVTSWRETWPHQSGFKMHVPFNSESYCQKCCLWICFLKYLQMQKKFKILFARIICKGNERLNFFALQGKKNFLFFPNLLFFPFIFFGWSNNEIEIKQINRRKTDKFHTHRSPIKIWTKRAARLLRCIEHPELRKGMGVQDTKGGRLLTGTQRRSLENKIYCYADKFLR